MSHKVFFGQVTYQTGTWISSVDGILGLAYQPLDCNPTCVTPVFDSLTSDGSMANIFSICMGDTSGFLILGDFDKTLYTGNIIYTPLMQQNYYVISMFDLKVNNNTVFVSDIKNSNNDKAIVDSGTTLLLLSSKY